MAAPRALRPLQGAFVERVDRPLPGLYALSLTFDDAPRCALLLAAGPPRPRPAWALVEARPRGDAADAHVRGLREKLERAHIAAFDESREGWTLVAERGEQRWRVEGRHGGVAVGPAPGAAGPGEFHLETPAEGPPSPAPLEAIAGAWQRGERFVDEQHRCERDWARRHALAAVRRARSRLAKRHAAVEADLVAIERAQRRAQEIAPFVAAAARAPRGATALEATDWSTGEARKVTLEIDPTEPAREQLEAVFARARRLRAGAPLAERRRDEAQLALWQIDEARPAFEAAESAAAVEAVVEALARELPRDVPLRAPAAPAPRDRAGAAPEREPFRRYEAETGAAVLVGRDAASNDELTARVARPGDLWLHAKGGAGSHVVVPGGCKKGAPDARALVDAATLAAHFSSLRGEAVVDVLYADRRHVRKRKGSAAGAVEVQRSKTIALRAEPGRLARLLASYRPPAG